MAFDLLLLSPAPPERVIAAISENTREWRESKIPRQLWTGGVLQVVSTVGPRHFRLHYDRRWTGIGGDPLALTGEVQGDGQGGSRIVARCGKSGAVSWLTTLFAVVIGAELITGHGLPWSALAVGVVFVGGAALADHSVSRQPGSEAAYLAERLEEAVRAASVPATDAQPA